MVEYCGLYSQQLNWPKTKEFDVVNYVEAALQQTAAEFAIT